VGFILGKKTSMIGEKNKFGLKFRFRLYPGSLEHSRRWFPGDFLTPVNFRGGAIALCCGKTNTSGKIPTMEYIIDNWYDVHVPKGQSAVYPYGGAIVVFQLFLTLKFRHVDPFCVGI
jgi:hypothetical protein